MKPRDRDEFERYVKTMNVSKRSICEGLVRAMEQAASSKEISSIITQSVIDLVKVADISKPVDVKNIFARLYLISDILFNT